MAGRNRGVVGGASHTEWMLVQILKMGPASTCEDRTEAQVAMAMHKQEDQRDRFIHGSREFHSCCVTGTKPTARRV